MHSDSHIYSRASPRLKDAQVPTSEYPALYTELLLMTRKLFHECKLVHADLSEYNILYHVENAVPSAATISPTAAADQLETERSPNGPRGHLYIIDVSQSVEHDHPHAFDFLRSDLRNVEEFFSKRGVQCLGLRRAFEFVTKENLDHEAGDAAALQAWLEQQELQEDGSGDHENDGGATDEARQVSAAHEDSVFMQSYIPRTLNEVYDPERDLGALDRGEGEKLIYKDTIGFVTSQKESAQGTGKAKVHFEDEEPVGGGDDNANESAGDDSDGESGDDSDSDADGTEFKERQPRGHRHEDKDAKKVTYTSRQKSSIPIHILIYCTGAQKSCKGRSKREAQAQNSESREEAQGQNNSEREMIAVEQIVGYLSIAWPRFRRLTLYASVMQPWLASETIFVYLNSVPWLTLRG